MNEYLEVKIPVKTDEEKFLAKALMMHGQIIAAENIIKQLQDWFDENNPTKPGDIIPDWYLGYRKAIEHIQTILEGEQK